MGCCSSRQAAADNDNDNAIPHNPPYRQTRSAPATESARNITSTSPARPSSTISTAPHAPPPNPNNTKSLLPNTSLRPIDPARRCALPDPLTIPTSTSSQNPGSVPWTRAKLEKERRDWWDTRDSGSREMWQAYRQMVRHLQEGEVQEAQTLLDAVGGTCPSGKLWHGVFDERGVEYAIRDGRRNYEWLVFEPVGVREDGVDGVGDGDEVNEEDNVETRTRNVGREKGKQKAEDGSEVLHVRCRLSSTGKDHVVELRKGDTIGSIMAQLSYITGLEPKRHRISYLGRLYGANETLPTEGERAWKEYNVLTVLVMEGP